MEEDQISPSSRPQATRLGTWGPVALVAAAILVLSSIPGTAFPSRPDVLNGVVHFLEFFFLGYFLSKALNVGRAMEGCMLILTSTLVCAAFGFLDELHQFLIPYRIFDFLDLVYDTLGALGGTTAYLLVGRPPEGRGGD